MRSSYHTWNIVIIERSKQYQVQKKKKKKKKKKHVGLPVGRICDLFLGVAQKKKGEKERKWIEKGWKGKDEIKEKSWQINDNKNTSGL